MSMRPGDPGRICHRRLQEFTASGTEFAKEVWRDRICGLEHGGLQMDCA